MVFRDGFRRCGRRKRHSTWALATFQGGDLSSTRRANFAAQRLPAVDASPAFTGSNEGEGPVFWHEDTPRAPSPVTHSQPALECMYPYLLKARHRLTCSSWWLIVCNMLSSFLAEEDACWIPPRRQQLGQGGSKVSLGERPGSYYLTRIIPSVPRSPGLHGFNLPPEVSRIRHLVG